MAAVHRGERFTRRGFLGRTCGLTFGTAIGVVALASACAPAPAPTATPAPPKAAEPTKPAVAATAKPAAPAEVTIGVWVWPNNDKVIEDLLPDFNKKFTGIKLNIVPTSQDYHPKLLTTLAAGEGVPDVAMVEISQVSLFTSKGGFSNLLDGPFDAKGLKDGYAKAGWAMGLSRDQRLYLLPKNMGTGVMFYRPELFEKASVKPEDAIKTWDDFVAVGQKLTVKDKQWMADNAKNLFKPILDQSGFGWFDQDGQPRINTPEATRALEVAVKIRKAAIDANLGSYTPAWYTSMKDQSVATYVSGSWLGNAIVANAPESKGKWRIMPVPADPGKPRAVNIGGDFMGIPEKAKYKEQAWTLIKYVCTDTDSLVNMWKTQQLWPWYIKNTDDKRFYEPDALFGGQEIGSICLQVAKDLPIIITDPNDPIASKIVNDEVALVIDKDKSPAQALKDAEAAVKDKVKK